MFILFICCLYYLDLCLLSIVYCLLLDYLFVPVIVLSIIYLEFNIIYSCIIFRQKHIIVTSRRYRVSIRPGQNISARV